MSRAWDKERIIIMKKAKKVIEIISPKCSPKNCNLRFLTIDNFLQKKTSRFVFECLNGTTCFPFRNYFQRFHYNFLNTRNNATSFPGRFSLALEMGRPTSKVNEERPGDEVGNNGKAAKLPKVKLDFARCSFYFLGGSLFNSLSLSLRNTNFKVLFRKALHDFTCNFYCSFKRFFFNFVHVCFLYTYFN